MAPPYRLDCSARVAAQFQALVDQARGPLVGRIKRAGREFLRRLSTDPLVFGNPIYTTAHLRLQVFNGVAPPLVVHFAVDQARKIVYILGFRLLRGVVP